MSRLDKILVTRPRRSGFPWRQRVQGDLEFGKLYPIFRRLMLPGDYFKISPRFQITFMPLVAPIMASIMAYVHYFFVPLRLLYKKVTDSEGDIAISQEAFRKWLSGGDNNDYSDEWPSVQGAGPLSLDDYMGFGNKTNYGDTAKPSSMWRRAYNSIYNYIYRNQNYQDEVDWDQSAVLRRNWRRDYITSVLPSRQRGPAVSLSSSFSISPIIWQGDLDPNMYILKLIATQKSGGNTNSFGFTATPLLGAQRSGGVYVRGDNPAPVVGTADSVSVNFNPSIPTGSQESWTPYAQAPSISFSIEDIRLANALQRWQELNMQSGIRYSELLMAHFGVAPSDALLQFPSYIGGMSSPVVVHQVTQQSSTDSTSPQGNLAGNAKCIGIGNNVVRYHAKEFGVIMGILSVMPRTFYQYGIGAEFRIRSRYDLPWPLMQNLGEQQVIGAELFASDNETDNKKVIGYQARWEHFRLADDYVCGRLRSDYSQPLDFWHLARKFDSLPEINGTFLQCNPDRRNFASQDQCEAVFDFCNHVRTVRPLTRYARPSL